MHPRMSDLIPPATSFERWSTTRTSLKGTATASLKTLAPSNTRVTRTLPSPGLSAVPNASSVMRKESRKKMCSRKSCEAMPIHQLLSWQVNPICCPAHGADCPVFKLRNFWNLNTNPIYLKIFNNLFLVIMAQYMPLTFQAKSWALVASTAHDTWSPSPFRVVPICHSIKWKYFQFKIDYNIIKKALCDVTIKQNYYRRFFWLLMDVSSLPVSLSSCFVTGRSWLIIFNLNCDNLINYMAGSEILTRNEMHRSFRDYNDLHLLSSSTGFSWAGPVNLAWWSSCLFSVLGTTFGLN